MTDLYDFLLKDIGTSFPWDSKLPADFDKDKSDVHMTYYLLVNFRHAEVIKKAEDNLSLGFAYQLFAAYSCFATFQFQKLGYFAERVLSDKEIDAYPFQKNRCLTLLFDSIVRGGGNPNELNKYTKNSVLNDFYQSIFDIKSGQMETAPKLLRQNIKKIPAGAMIGLFNGAKTVLSPREISRLSSSPVLGVNLKLYYHKDYIKHLPTDTDVLYFAACDKTYFLKYAPFFIKGIEILNPDAIVHIDILCDEGFTEQDVFNAVPQTKIRFNYTLTNDPVGSSGIIKIPFYASYRFIVLDRYLGLYDIPIIITDIDLIPENNNEFVLNSSSAIIIRDFGVNYYPWQRYPAGWIAVKPETEACKFISILKCYLCAVLEKASFFNEGVWFLDQSALFSVITMLKNSMNDYRIGKYTSDKKPYFNFNYGSQKTLHVSAVKTKVEHMDCTLKLIAEQNGNSDNKCDTHG